jgi:hypothetical protein
MNITGCSKSWNEYYMVIKKLCIFSMLPCYDACNNWLFFYTVHLLAYTASHTPLEPGNLLPDSLGSAIHLADLNNFQIMVNKGKTFIRLQTAAAV